MPRICFTLLQTHLARTPLHFANASPPSGWVEDVYLKAVAHTRNTEEWPPHEGAAIGLEERR